MQSAHFFSLKKNSIVWDETPFVSSASFNHVSLDEKEQAGLTDE
jgi:hypothetical protein